jgi:Putative zinc-finger
MAADNKNGMQCAEFDALLSDALDLTLGGDNLERFQAHARTCPLCGPLLQEAEAGQRWLKSLELVEAPANLVHNILVATSGVETRRHGEAIAASWRKRLAQAMTPVLGLIRQPRFAMSFGMVFFSLSICLSVLGIKPSDLQHVDLRPSAIKRSYYETTGRVVKYYENIRFVYEIESRVREFKRVTEPVEQAPANPTERKKDNSERQEQQRQERNYSQGDNQPVLAALPDDPPVVMGTTYRRYV